jgi:hypothetical protein
MSVTKVAEMRAIADEFSITPGQWEAFRDARHSAAIAFYVELRRALVDEYRTGAPFTLPAKDLAAQQFLPGRRDRKLYMKLRDELVRLGLIVRVAHAGFTADGRRSAGLFMFLPGQGHKSSNVVFLASRRGHR